jgi:hypothetical protein
MSEAADYGNDLMVDFSYRRRPLSTDSRQVSFSEDMTIHNFEYPSSEEVSKRWQSKSDKVLSTSEMLRDIRSIRRLLTTRPIEELEKETLYGSPWCMTATSVSECE